jgi:hypothetical protein
MVVVGSWVTQSGRGGGVFVSFDGRPVGEVLKKTHQFRVTLPPSGTSVNIRVHTTGVSRRHRKATFTFKVDSVAGQGVLVMVSCAVGYLWPLVRSHPAQVHIFQCPDLEVPRSRWWRMGFKNQPDESLGRVLLPDSDNGHR